MRRCEEIHKGCHLIKVIESLIKFMSTFIFFFHIHLLKKFTKWKMRMILTLLFMSRNLLDVSNNYFFK